MTRRTTTWTLFAGGPDGIPVEVERKRVRRLNLRVRADGSAHLSVPARCPLAEAQRFLDAHEAWLHDHVRRREARADVPDDGLVPLWGALVPLPAGAASDELYRTELAARLPEVAARMEAALGVHASGWQLRAMSTRWGSCTPRTARVRINVRLAAYPPTCLDYVVAHELTHLLEPSHSERFHALLAGAYPNEHAARALLRRPARELAADSCPTVNADETNSG
ncbi:SprT family zinc-dependent metalloprotease [Olsenella sp. An270]|uniref:M48 family metallopeptidase n=1 Tax=Olsenella sp. An270 TaxID=1965615 RepID=UPI000B38960E|nr:SprT family zinc-dependent metalloprotease [Olsenella sp. An270]OUO60777.1 hypothetical protein B5F73_00525 [Olsenella sp. An270]